MHPLIEEIRVTVAFVENLDLRRQARSRIRDGGLLPPSAWEVSYRLDDQADAQEEVYERAEEAAADRKRRAVSVKEPVNQCTFCIMNASALYLCISLHASISLPDHL